MKILLLNPPILGIDKPPVPPLGISYIAAVLKKNNFIVDLIDLDLEREKFKNIYEIMASYRPDLVGISGLTIQMENVYYIAKVIKKISKKIIVVTGGPHPSSLSEQTLKEAGGNIDIVVAGEGEFTLLDIAMDKPWEQIEGILYIKDGKIYGNKKREPISDLDSLPFPARDMLAIKKYRGWGPLRESPTTHLIASRGCPFDCIFCSETAVFGRNHRRRDPKRVVDEIEHLIKEYGMREVSFYDDLFTLNKKWVISVCHEIIKRNIKLDWKALSRVDTVDYEVLSYMKKAGCRIIFYGIESGSQKILDNIRKSQTVEQNLTAARLTKKVGIEMFAFFMIGNVGETQSTIYQTIKLARRIKPRYYQFTIARPDPGSYLYNEYIQEINEKNLSWGEYYAFPDNPAKMIVVGSEVSNQELIIFRKLAYMAMRPMSLIKNLIKAAVTFNLKQVKRILKVWF
ncbi:MAG: B12-binding domain-containing radical SAM protein [Omnitrophica bacterium]|nr:B12-binding domain-containing radical SAM protein [Candidatus Omnitrophota bacterium]